MRHERPLARPRKQVTEGDVDDEPTYVVEGSQDTLSKQEYENLLGKEELNGEGKIPQMESLDASVSKEMPESAGKAHLDNTLDVTTEKAAAIGGTKKKRIITAIGADDNGYDESSEKIKPFKAKKSKKVKLSFDED